MIETLSLSIEDKILLNKLKAEIAMEEKEINDVKKYYLKAIELSNNKSDKAYIYKKLLNIESLATECSDIIFIR